MQNSTLLRISTKDCDSDKETTKKTYDHNDRLTGNGSKIIASDYIKIIAINTLLLISIILYNYEIPLTEQSQTNLHPVVNNISKINETEEIDDNPYGFHPFYQVHRRIQYKNPPVNPCNNIDPKKTLLFAILSRASNVHIREAIRLTWGARRTYNDIEVRLTFLVGVDDGMIKQIEIEQLLHHDVVQVNLPENYPVVSYKELAAICWSKYNCPGIQYVFKVDEDIHLNTPLLTRIISGFIQNETIAQTPTMFGWFRHKSRVDRKGRYLVTEEEYPGFYYPPYTFGIGYLLTKAGRDNLCIYGQRPHPVTRVGDAYITGILRDHAMVQYARFGDVHYIYSGTLNGPHCYEYFTYDPKLLVCMSGLHSGVVDVADEYVHVWDAVYKEKGEDLAE
ncbi:unnamed protein product [Rotaria socialis]|uniref:Hexosyltransferase n=1 Tax=Rotaria socialis TaxID=392032 RepID=A0A817TJR3_9BILA|nr:unnamed protein product [Rotaria socialis]CAF3347423.1 unnamed protein product [Rotaria socialis]CAF3460964.1 unnamed protein product [Rotaria socialis]CAF3678446.1 unnamed protein product [Rotaria socialis]CAF3706554.1 unnamed protein product [Rotaria socialis]